jgi:gliding motility-associated-like protein
MKCRFLLLLTGLFSTILVFAESTKALKSNFNITSSLCVISADLNHTDVSCHGLSDGEITIRNVVAGGVVEFSVDNGITWQEDSTFLGLPAQNYAIVVRQQLDHSCTVVLDAFYSVVEPAQLDASIVKEDISCNTLDDGEISVVNPSGGSGTYQFSKDGVVWQDSPLFENLSVGSYNIRIRDKNNPACMRVLPGSHAIVKPAQMTTLVSTDEITCFGANNGAIYFKNNKGGSGDYNFSIDNGLNWLPDSSFKNLAGGVYSLLIQDANNLTCIRTIGSVTLKEPAAILATFSKEDANCNGAKNGSITVDVEGSYVNYLFSNDGGSSFVGPGEQSYTFGNLDIGSYSLVVKVGYITPACLYTFSSPVVINEPDRLAADISKIDANCYGVDNASIEFTNVSGGSGDYEYSVRSSASWNNNPLKENLAVGNYNIKIRDANVPSCEVLLNSSLAISEPPILNAQISSVPTSCYNTNDGQINIANSAGGTYGNYEYSINGGVDWSTNNSFTNLLPGSYNVTIRDADVLNCSRVISNNLKISEQNELKASLEFTNPNCHGASNGQIIIKNQSGRPNLDYYSYSINGGYDWNVDDTISNLPAGIYNVRIKDQFSACSKIINSSLELVAPGLITSSFSKADLNCFGDASGQILFSNYTGGTGMYNYSNDGGNTWQGNELFENLSAGSYHLMIRDALVHTCVQQVATNVVLTQPTELKASISNNLIECFGDSTGEIIFSNFSGGVPPYLFSIDNGANWQISPVFSNLVQGTYPVIIKDPTCENTIVESLVINQNAKLTVDINQEDITCYGNNTGKISLSNPKGGNGTSYQYSKDGGFTWNTYSGSGDFVYSNLYAGDYNLKMKDAACIVTLATPLTLNQVDPLAGSHRTIDVTCFAASDGQIVFENISGGSGEYEYRIKNTGSWSVNPTFNSLSPGSYQLSLRDLLDTTCTLSLGSVSINEPVKLAATITKTNADCYGVSSGKIGFSNPSGGYGSYEYSINNGNSWRNTGFENLAIGNYQVLLRDADTTSCIVSLGSINIDQPNELGGIVVIDSVTCFGMSNGKLTVYNPTGGSGTYEYSYDNQSTWTSQPLVSGLSAGIYQVFVRDAAVKTCVKFLGAYFVNQPTAITLTTSQVNQTCFGGNIGEIHLDVKGGSNTFEYSIDNGGSWSVNPSFENLSAGAFQILITDKLANTCQVSGGTITITQPDAIQVQVSVKNTNCFGAQNGALTLSVNGGIGPFEYSKDNGVSWQSESTFTGLGASSYQVLAREASEHTCGGISAVVSVAEPAVLDASFTTTDVTCNAKNTGIINVAKASSETRNLQYSIDNGLTWRTNPLFTDKHAGNYKVFVRNADTISCVNYLGEAIINQPAPLYAIVQIDSLACFGGNNGKISVPLLSGGSGNYEFSFDNGTNWGASSELTGLSAGFYNVSIRDKADISCSLNLAPAFVNQPAPILATATIKHVDCASASNGSIEMQTNGGSGQYEYSIDMGASWVASNVFNNLLAGIYTIEVRDALANTCRTTVSSIEITEPASLQLVTTANSVNCYGASNGSVEVQVSGGNGLFEFSIDNGTSWTSFTTFIGLKQNSYEVIVREKNTPLCYTSSGQIQINEPKQMDVSFSVTDATCFSGNSGTISLNKGVLETRNLEYSIDNGTIWTSNSVLNGLSKGTYPVLVRNADTTSCSRLIGQAVINQPDKLSAIVQIDSITCFGGNTGEISLQLSSGGSGNYEYSFDNGTSWGANSELGGLTAGFYGVAIRDKDDPACFMNLGAANVNQPTAIVSSALINTIKCAGASSGNIDMQTNGGSGQYQYSIDMGASWGSSGTFSGLLSGTYAIEVRDVLDNTCIIAANPIEITEPDPLQLITTANPVSCYGASNGSIDVQVSGGTGPYEFSLNNGVSWTSFTPFLGLKKNVYEVLVREKNTPSCSTSSGLINITEPKQLNAAFTFSNITCFSGDDGSISIVKGTSETRNLEYSINNGVNWFNSTLVTGLAEGTYPVSVRNADTTSCFRLIGQALIVEPDKLSANVKFDSVTCFGGNNGRIYLENSSGGSGNYEYSFDNGLTWGINAEYAGLNEGSYNVSIRDKDEVACWLGLGTVLINEPEKISVSYVKTDISCFGSHTGSVSVLASGGSKQYEYSLDNPLNWGNDAHFGQLPAGNYTVLVRDINDTNCVTSTGLFEIVQPVKIDVLVNKVDIECSGFPKGSIQLTAPVVGSFEFSFDNKTTWVTTTQLNDLEAGTVNIAVRDITDPSCEVDLPAVEIKSYELKMDSPLISAVSCSGKSDGSIVLNNVHDLSASVFEFSIDAGLNWQASSSFTGLDKGIYAVLVRNTTDLTCFKEVSAIEVDSPEILSVQGLIKQITCDEKGAIVLEKPEGGASGQYEFSIDGNTWTDQLEYTNLNAGNYMLIMRDAMDVSCSRTIEASIVLQDVVRITGYVAEKNDVTGCAGSLNGGFKVWADGGYDAFQFSIWNGSTWSGYTTDIYNALNPYVYSDLGPETYKVRIKDPSDLACGYTISDIVIKHDNVLVPANVSLNNYTYVCSTSDSLVIAANTSNVTSYSWQLNGIDLVEGGAYSGTKTSQLVVKPITGNLHNLTFALKVDGNCQPSSILDSTTIQVDQQISSTILGDFSVCMGDSIQPMQLIGLDTMQVINWEVYDMSTNSWQAILGSSRQLTMPVFADPDKKYYKSLLKNGVCPLVYTDSVEMVFNPLPIVKAGNDTIIQEGEQVQLFGSGGKTFYWLPGESLNDSTLLNPIAKPEQTTVYYHYVTNEFGCTAAATVTIEVFEDPQLFVPNTFTPNGDGINDTWIIRTIDQYPSSSIEIFSRWGVKIYQKSNGVVPWDGISSGKVLPTGTYFYVLKLTPDSKPISGSISIVR